MFGSKKLEFQIDYFNDIHKAKLLKLKNANRIQNLVSNGLKRKAPSREAFIVTLEGYYSW